MSIETTNTTRTLAAVALVASVTVAMAQGSRENPAPGVEEHAIVRQAPADGIVAGAGRGDRMQAGDALSSEPDRKVIDSQATGSIRAHESGGDGRAGTAPSRLKSGAAPQGPADCRPAADCPK